MEITMEDVNDADLRRAERPNSYAHSRPSPVHGMPAAETGATLHNSTYPHPPPPSNAGSWYPPPSPYVAEDQRQPHPGGEQPPPQHHHHHHQQQQPPYSAPPREQPPAYGPDPQYNNRQGSTSAPPTRSPPQHAPYPPVNGNAHEGQYYQPHPPPPDYRPPPMRYSYPPPETAPNGALGLQVATGHEMMPGQATGTPQGQHYGPPGPHSAGPPHTPVYGPPYYPPNQSADYQRRKPVRAAQACDSCRQRKAKCDEGRPECEHCKQNNLKCSYRDIQPPKQEKQVLQINDKLEAMHDSINKMLEKHDTLLSSHGPLLSSHSQQLELLQRMLPSEQRDQFQIAKRDTQAATASTPVIASTPIIKHEQRTPLITQTSMSSQNLLQQAVGADEIKISHEFSLPPKHFTAAQNLMEWPSVKALLEDFPDKPTYVLDLESNRGLLRLYGCGEGEDDKDGRAGPASPANSHSSSSGSRLDDETSIPSPSGVWGSGQLPPRSSGPTTADHAGGVGAHGGLTLDQDTVDKYFKSYMRHMHILHPFLEAKVLRDMVHLFKRRYSFDFVHRLQGTRGTSTGKRKREADDSPMSFEMSITTSVSRSHRRGPNDPVEIEHSIANAIVLLVMALGKICDHRAPLPNAVHTDTIARSTPANHFSDMPSSAPNSPYYARSQAINAKSGDIGAHISSPADPRGKNMDVIPGLAYFAQGADILGELPGGSQVSHVQANILAGLYMGQLARILPAHYYFSNASRGCMVLIESTAYKTSQFLKEAERNLINFAFWSCLQLESDILAEVELPPSGITRYEGQMNFEMPTQVTLDPIPESSDMDVALRFYSYQVQLRRTLNEVHSNLYMDKSEDGFSKPNKVVSVILNQNLEGWRKQLANYNWDDRHHKSQDINVARMRGKYYGAKYIIHRPALAYALYLASGATPPSRPSESPAGGQRNSQLKSPNRANRYPNNRSDMGPPEKAHELDSDPWIRESAKVCVDAAICSTTVFDEVPERLVVTNIFGTAHAQFGNMLVLAATYKSSLGYLIEEEQLRTLLDRTIKFLQKCQDISPSLKYDAEILTKIYKKIWPNQDYSGRMSSSFGS